MGEGHAGRTIEPLHDWVGRDLKAYPAPPPDMGWVPPSRPGCPGPHPWQLSTSRDAVWVRKEQHCHPHPSGHGTHRAASPDPDLPKLFILGHPTQSTKNPNGAEPIPTSPSQLLMATAPPGTPVMSPVKRQ